MKIVIAGGGKVGQALCKNLVREGFDIILIEKDERILNHLINQYDITGLVGLAENYDDLLEAGINEADVFIAATPEDEINIISSLIAKQMGAKDTIARVRNPVYKNHNPFFTKEMGISLIVNPELLAAQEMFKTLIYPESLSVESFANNEVNIHELKIQEGSVLDGEVLFDFRSKYDGILVCLIKRGEELIIPSGNDSLQVGDHIYITASDEVIKNFKYKTGFILEKIDSLMILGGGIACYYLLEKLENKDIHVKVFEIDENKAKHLSQRFPIVHVINEDGTDLDLLKEERLESYKAFISYTGIDEENILSSLRAISHGVLKTITKVNRTALLDVIDNSKLQTIITSKQYVVERILRFIRSKAYKAKSEIEVIHKISDTDVEFSQFLITEDSPVVSIPLKDLDIRKNTLIVYIIRDNEIFFPDGSDTIELGDHVITVSFGRITDICQILEN